MLSCWGLAALRLPQSSQGICLNCRCSLLRGLLHCITYGSFCLYPPCSLRVSSFRAELSRGDVGKVKVSQRGTNGI